MRTLVVLCVAVFLAACVETPVQQDPSRQKVSVTVTGPDMPVTRSTPLSWYSDVISINDTGATPEKISGAIPDWVKGEIQAQMEAKGFQFTDQVSRYQVVGVLMVGEGEASLSTQTMFRLFPSLQGPEQEHPKGTLLLGILDSDTQRGVWRSALQTYTTPDAEEAARRERISGLIAGMLKNLKPSR